MDKMKVVFVGFGSLGDVVPLLAVAERMKHKHDVVFLANEYFRDFIERRAVAFHSIGNIADQLSAKESEQSSGETKEGRAHRFDRIIGRSFERAYRYLEHLVQSGARPVVISHGNLSPAIFACEAFNLPTVMTYYSPSHIPHNDEDAIQFFSFQGKNAWFLRHIEIPFKKWKQRVHFDVKDRYNEYRVKCGLPPAPGLLRSIWYSTFRKRAKLGARISKRIALLPDWFCEPIDKKLADVKFVGFAFLDSPAAVNQDLEAFLSEHPRPVVFTPGTAVEDVREFCALIIPICRKLGSPGIFVSRHGKAAFDALPKVADVPLFFLDHAEFDTLLPKARCLIHHGGIGTVAQAVRAGIPQIVRPRMYDQPANGLRVMLFGLGGSLAPAHFTPDTVARALFHIENSPLHKERIPYYSNLVQQQSGAQNCALEIESYLQSLRASEDHYPSRSQADFTDDSATQAAQLLGA
jgi:rhamnosyltransferase subunit B